jgi:hypothetical protein
VNAIESEKVARTPPDVSATEAPEIREVDAATVEELRQKAAASAQSPATQAPANPNDKKNWL